jgi:hypothetical protein
MRWLPRTIPFVIGIIALDFTLVFGLEAWRIFFSPIAGLDHAPFARVVYGFGKLGSLTPAGLVNLAILFGIIYLTIAVMCLLYLASRIGALRGSRIEHDMLDAALILVVVSTLVAGTPVILQGTSDILILQRLPLWLVGLAATLSMVERLPEIDKTRPPGFWERRMTRLLARRNRDETTYVTPAARENGATARWNELRSEAGMKLRAELKTNGAPFRCFEV